MVETHYRWDFIGLSTDTKPTPATSEKVVDGSTYYTSDNSKLYVWYKDQWYEKEGTGGGTTYTAGDNITITDGVISATDTTYSNFTGTDGTAAGAAGLVPAPATTDAGKFLKADGTWDTAGGGGEGKFIELTSADYNWPVNNPNGVALWKLPNGIYHVDNTSSLATKIYAYNGDTAVYYDSDTFLVTDKAQSTQYKLIYVFGTTGGDQNGPTLFRYYPVLKETGYMSNMNSLLDVTNIADTLTFDSNKYPLSARQGKVLNDKIEGRVATNAGTPTTATVGTVGQILEDTTNGKLYQCTAIDTTDPQNPSYTWTEVGAGGGGSGVIELTSADYDWPENSPDGIQKLNLPGGLYKWAAGVKTYTANSSTTGAGMILVGEPTQNVAVFMNLWPEQEGFIWLRYNRKTNQILDYANFCDIKDNLTSSSSSYSNCPLSARQGYVLDQKITPTSASGAPTTSTVGEVGKIYVDTATDTAYMCVKKSGSTYTWKQITA